jgi:sugar O-acyltransferase (sialic acid O-acetyltransferase NeuD family)
MKKISIFGAGGFGREIKEMIDQINSVNNTWDFIGFWDDNKSLQSPINDSLFLGGTEELNKYSGDELYLVCAVGEPNIKENILSKIKNPLIKFPILIHPSAIIGNRKYVKISEGTIITAGVIITVNIEIGKHVILNLSTTVGHDTKIGDFSSFMPSVNISGEVNIGNNVYVGTGAKIINQLKIGKNTTVGAGAVVAKSLPENCTAVGIPAKPIKFKN